MDKMHEKPTGESLKELKKKLSVALHAVFAERLVKDTNGIPYLRDITNGTKITVEEVECTVKWHSLSLPSLRVILSFLDGQTLLIRIPYPNGNGNSSKMSHHK